MGRQKKKGGDKRGLTDIGGEGDVADGGVQVDDIRRTLEAVKMSRQPLRNAPDGAALN